MDPVGTDGTRALDGTHVVQKLVLCWTWTARWYEACVQANLNDEFGMIYVLLRTAHQTHQLMTLPVHALLRVVEERNKN